MFAQSLSFEMGFPPAGPTSFMLAANRQAAASRPDRWPGREDGKDKRTEAWLPEHGYKIPPLQQLLRERLPSPPSIRNPRQLPTHGKETGSRVESKLSASLAPCLAYLALASLTSRAAKSPPTRPCRRPSPSYLPLLPAPPPTHLHPCRRDSAPSPHFPSPALP